MTHRDNSIERADDGRHGMRSANRREVLKAVGGLSAATMIGFAGCTGINDNGSSTPGSGGTGTATQATDKDATGTATQAKDNGGTGETFTVGIMIPMTGEFSSLGSLYRPAFEAWANMINDRGGIDGHPITVRFEDNESTAVRTTKIARQFVQDGAVFMVNAYSSPLTRAAGNVADSAKIPLFSTGSVNYELTAEYNYVFQFEPPMTRRTDAAVIERTVSKVACWCVDLGWAKLSQKAFINEVAPRHNLEVVFSDIHSRGQRDFSALVQKAQNTEAQALLTTNYPQHVIPQTRDIDTSQWSPSYYSAMTATSDNIYKALGKEVMQGLTAPSLWTKGVNLHPDTNEFIKRYESLTDVSVAEYHGALAFGSLQHFGAAVKALGNVVANGPQLKQWFDTSTAPTVLGTSKFDKRGVQVGIKWLLSQWHGENNPLIYPAKVASAELIYPKPWP